MSTIENRPVLPEHWVALRHLGSKLHPQYQAGGPPDLQADFYKAMLKLERLRVILRESVTIPVAAFFLDVSRSTIYRQIESGKLTTVRKGKRGGLVEVTVESLIAYQDGKHLTHAVSVGTQAAA